MILIFLNYGPLSMSMLKLKMLTELVTINLINKLLVVIITNKLLRPSDVIMLIVNMFMSLPNLPREIIRENLPGLMSKPEEN